MAITIHMYIYVYILVNKVKTDKGNDSDEHTDHRLLPKDKGSDLKAFITINTCNMYMI